MIVALDGPVGVGKTSVARSVARRLGLLHIDTGAMYRALAWRCLEEDLDPKDPAAMTGLAERTLVSLEPAPDGPRVFCNMVDVTEAIRAPEVSALVADVSSHPGLRKVVVQMQRSLGRSGSVIMEGTDIGTVVFPNADVKVFLDAGEEARVKRRTSEFESKGIPYSHQEVRDSIVERDKRERRQGKDGPRIAPDALRLDTSELDFEEVVSRVIRLIRRTIRSRSFDA